MLSPWCTVKIHYNGDGGCAFVFVECIERCRVDPGRKECTFVLVCVLIWNCYSCSMIQYEVVISPWCDVQIRYNNGDDGCTLMFVECMERSRVGPGRTNSAFVLVCVLNLKVLFIFDTVWSRKLALMWCSHNYNVDGGCTFMLVEYMTRCRVGPGRKDGTLVLVCVWILRYYLCWIQYEVVISP